MKDGFFDAMNDGIERLGCLEPAWLVVLATISLIKRIIIPIHYEFLIILFLILVILGYLLCSIHIQIHLLNQLIHECTLFFCRQEWVFLDYFATFRLETRQ
jgi:hypothetical protein